MKAAKTRVSKELQDLKASNTLEQSTAAKQKTPMVVDDLEKSQAASQLD